MMAVLTDVYPIRMGSTPFNIPYYRDIRLTIQWNLDEF